MTSCSKMFAWCAAVVSNANDSDSDTDMWDDAAVPVPAAFFDSNDKSNFEGLT